MWVWMWADSAEVADALCSHGMPLPLAESPCGGNAQLRLLICYAATHPENMNDAKAAQWAKLADLTEADMSTITALESLGVPVRKKGTAAKSKIFSRKPRAKNTRKVGLQLHPPLHHLLNMQMNNLSFIQVLNPAYLEFS